MKRGGGASATPTNLKPKAPAAAAAPARTLPPRTARADSRAITQFLIGGEVSDDADEWNESGEGSNGEGDDGDEE